jgi:hypothetical protein
MLPLEIEGTSLTRRGVSWCQTPLRSIPAERFDYETLLFLDAGPRLEGRTAAAEDASEADSLDDFFCSRIHTATCSNWHGNMSGYLVKDRGCGYRDRSRFATSNTVCS